MKKAFYLTALLGLLFSCSQTDEPEVMTQDEPTAETRGLFTKNVVIEWNEEGQELDGFGIAEADCAADIFTHPKRKEVMDLLFGKDGLNISILRGEIFPHYWMKEGDTSFDTDVRTDMPLGDPYFQQAEANELKRRGQLWVTQQAKQLYHVDKLFFSWILRMEIRCPSRDTILNSSPLISKSSPVISLLLSLSEIEKMVCLTTSFSVN